LRTVGVVLVGADFTPGMTIGTGLYLPHPVGIVIGNGLQVGNNVMIAQGVTAGVRNADHTVVQEFPTICDGATVWSHATIVGGVRIGENSEVGANSLVIADVPDYAVVVGVPARKIGEVNRDHPPQSGSITAASR
jgi:serine O-acetyltransferase